MLRIIRALGRAFGGGGAAKKPARKAASADTGLSQAAVGGLGNSSPKEGPFWTPAGAEGFLQAPRRITTLHEPTESVVEAPQILADIAAEIEAGPAVESNGGAPSLQLMVNEIESVAGDITIAEPIAETPADDEPFAVVAEPTGTHPVLVEAAASAAQQLRGLLSEVDASAAHATLDDLIETAEALAEPAAAAEMVLSSQRARQEHRDLPRRLRRVGVCNRPRTARLQPKRDLQRLLTGGRNRIAESLEQRSSPRLLARDVLDSVPASISHVASSLRHAA